MAKAKQSPEGAAKAENPRILLAYAGVVLNTKGVIFHVYHEVGDDWRTHAPDDRVHGYDDDPKGTRTRWYGKRFGFATPGTVISVEYDADKLSSVYSGTAKRVGQYDSDRCLEWGAQSRAVEDAKAAVSTAKKAEKDAKDAFADLLEPIRKAYQTCANERQRVAILTRVTAIITRRHKGDKFKLYL